MGWAPVVTVGDRSLPLRAQWREKNGLKSRAVLGKPCMEGCPGHVTLAPHLRPSGVSQCEGVVCPLTPCPGKPWPGCQTPQLIATSF